MSKSTVPASWKVCATCANYCGNVISDPFGKFISYDTEERAMCAIKRMKFPAITCACSSYEERF